MTPVLQRIHGHTVAASEATKSFQQAASNPIAAKGFAAANHVLRGTEEFLRGIIEGMNEVKDKQPPVEKGFGGWQQAVMGVNQALQLVRAASSAVHSAYQGAVDAANEQITTQTRLATILGSNSDITAEQYSNLKNATAEYSRMTTFSESALTAGLSELATYRLSAEALEEMVGTLGDFAAGQSGINVGTHEMIQLANQLGKALDGNYGGLTKIGFQLTEDQKAIIATGDEMERVAVITEVIGQSYGGLAEALAGTPLGQVTALQNAWGNVYQEIGQRLLPAIAMVNAEQASLVEMLQSDTAQGFYDTIYTGAQLAGAAIGGIVRGVNEMIVWFNSGSGVANFVLRTVIIGGAIAAGFALVLAAKSAIVAWAPVLAPFLAVGAAVALVMGLLDSLGVTGEDVAGLIGGAFFVMGALIHNIFAGIANAFIWLANKAAEVMAFFTKSEAQVFDYIEYKDLDEAFQAGQGAGSELVRNLEDMFTFKPFEIEPLPDGSTFDIGTVDEVTRIRDPINLAEEDLRYLLDERERRFIANVNLESPAPRLEIIIENVNNVEDLDEFLNRAGDKLRELSEAAVAIVPGL